MDNELDFSKEEIEKMKKDCRVERSEYYDDIFKDILKEAFRVMIPKHISYGKRSYGDLDQKAAVGKVMEKIKMKISRIEKFLEGELYDESEVDFYSNNVQINSEIEMIEKSSGKVIKTVDLARLYFEGVEDAFIDMINYATMSIIILRKKWGLPLSPKILKEFKKGNLQ